MVLMFYALLVGSVVNSSNIFANLKQIVRITKEYALKHVFDRFGNKKEPQRLEFCGSEVCVLFR